MGKQSRIANSQRRMAADLLKAGTSRIWMDPSGMEKIGRAITRADMRRLIKKGLIKAARASHAAPSQPAARPQQPSPKSKLRRQRTGSRKGTHAARNFHGPKESWLKIIRPQRAMLAELKSQLKPMAYRRLYRMVKGSAFRSRAHLQAYIKEQKLLRK